jgi:hypothetical protein
MLITPRRKWDSKQRRMTGSTPPEALEATGGFFPQQWPDYLTQLCRERPNSSVDLILVDPRIEEQPPGLDPANGWSPVHETGGAPCYQKDRMRVRCMRMTLRWPLTKFGVLAASRQGTPGTRESAAPALVEAAIAAHQRGGVCCYMQWTHAQGGSLGEYFNSKCVLSILIT